jgi:hypothetical protein
MLCHADLLLQTTSQKLTLLRMGNPIIDARLGLAFCTTSCHFPLREIDFEDGLAPVEGQVDSKGNDIMEPVEDNEEHGQPFAFHGQPVHPLDHLVKPFQQ